MPVSQAMTGLGLIFEIKTTPTGATYAAIAEVFDITPPEQMDDEIEVTHFASPEGVKEFIGGLTDPGECSFQLNYVPESATEDMLLEAKATRRPRGVRITWPNGATWTFDLLIRGYQPTAPLNDRLTVTVTGRVSGAIVRAAGV